MFQLFYLKKKQNDNTHILLLFTLFEILTTNNY